MTFLVSFKTVLGVGHFAESASKNQGNVGQDS
jgi:hypothetical protein